MGSVHYFSPEHARGGYTDSKSDLYSLGVVMYEMLTGRVPFDADTPVSVALKHMQEEPVPPIDINPKIPHAINDIILKAMRKDTTLRYQSATEMLSDLNRALKDPNGDFVDNNDYPEMEATRKIPTLNNEEIRSENLNKNQNQKKKGKFATFVKTHKKLSIAIIILILFILSVVGTMLYFKLTKLEDVAIPNLVGISREEAEKMITDSKLKLGNVTEEYNSEYAAGYVISQDPEYRENYNKVKENSSINLVVSLGIEEAIVPKVVGLTEEQAVKALEDAKLKYEIVEESSKKVEAGYVIKQETDADTKVYAGDTVKIHVSTGVKMSTVTSVMGKSESDAKKELKDLGLEVVVTEGEDRTKDNGVVIKQSIEPGEKVESGSTITITINKIVEDKNATITVNVKSLLGGKYETADDTLGNSTSGGTIKQVQVKITVDDDTVYDEKVDPTTTNLMQPISGKGTVKVKVYVDDVLKKSKDINLNNENKLTIE